jgi:hypothetical protein
VDERIEEGKKKGTSFLGEALPGSFWYLDVLMLGATVWMHLCSHSKGSAKVGNSGVECGGMPGLPVNLKKARHLEVTGEVCLRTGSPIWLYLVHERAWLEESQSLMPRHFRAHLMACCVSVRASVKLANCKSASTKAAPWSVLCRSWVQTIEQSAFTLVLTITGWLTGDQEC